MTDVAVGDKVLSFDADGTAIWDQVYLIGHRDSRRSGQYVEFTLTTTSAVTGANASDAPRWTLVQSYNHYAESECGARRCTKLAAKVAVGDTMWVLAADSSHRLVKARVLQVRASLEQPEPHDG